MKRVIAALRRELRADLAVVSGLSAVEARQGEIDELLEDLDRQLERVRGAAVITLVGATGAGKSTLLNALVGRAIAREGEDRPTTAAPVIYRPRDADLRDLLERLPGEPPEVVDYDPDAGGPWRDQILIDAPDVNSVAALHREVVAALAANSDVLLVVAHRQSVSELASVAFVDAFAGRRGMLVVLNRADELTEVAREELLTELRRIAAERWNAPDAPVLAISAKRAQSEPGSPGWAELCEHLRELVRGGWLGRVRRHNAIGTAGRVSELFAEVAREFDPTLLELDQVCKRGIEGWLRRVDREVGERLELRKPHLSALLWNEIARRWDGPGGWALRAGGLSALGLGAGAELARRNPLIAAGAAVGALAADRARDSVRQRQFSDSAGLLPGEGELEEWYREELGGARILARRATGSPTALGVPSAGELAQGASAAVVDGWERLVERELLRVAEACARWYVRWPVDIPVYAMGAWVVSSAATGFFTGDYVGFDFLVNALLVLFAWLFLARTAVRTLLAGRSTQLLTDTRRFCARALTRATGHLSDAAGEAVAARRESLHRLTELEGRWRSRITGAGDELGS